MYTVYMHINKINNKKYIGITSQIPENRWANGKGYKRYDRNRPEHETLFYKAIKKYGWDNFNHIIIKSDITKDEAETMEVELISKYNTTNHDFGYNVAIGGLVNVGMIRSDEYKSKLSKIFTGSGNPNFGMKRSEETKLRMRNAQLGKKHSNETEEKMRQAKLGKEQSEETRKKHSESKKGFKHSEYSKNKMSKIAKEHVSEEQIECLKKLGKSSAKKVYQYDKNLNLIRTYNSTLEAEKFGFLNSSVSKCCIGKLKTYKGFIFRYEPI